MPWGIARYELPDGSFVIEGGNLSNFGWRFGDAEQAKSTGGMVALYPRTDDALKMAVPGAEPPQDLHVTLAYLGEDVSSLGDPGQLSLSLSQVADRYGVIEARCMGHATFNPDNGPNGDMDPCAVYLISDNDQLPDLHKDVLEAANQLVGIATQHAPWIPHMTAGYGLTASQLSYTGPVVFDRISLKWAGQSHDFPLQEQSL